MRHCLNILILVVSLLIFSSCSCSRNDSFWEWGEGEKREIGLHFNWDNLGAGESVPEELKIVLFCEKKQIVIIKDIKPGDFIINIPDGEYKLLVFNNDVSSIAFDRLYDYNKATAYLRTSSETKAGELIEVMETKSFYCANNPGFSTGPGAFSSISMVMTPLTKTIDVRISGLFLNEMESCNATFTNISSRINLSTKEIDTSSLSCYCFDLSGNLGVNGYSAKKYVFGIVNPSTCMLRLDYVTKGGYQGTTFVPVGVALMNINNESVSSVVLTLEFLRIESGITATLKEWSETVVKDETAE